MRRDQALYEAGKIARIKKVIMVVWCREYNGDWEMAQYDEVILSGDCQAIRWVLPQGEVLKMS